MYSVAFHYFTFSNYINETIFLIHRHSRQPSAQFIIYVHIAKLMKI